MVRYKVVDGFRDDIERLFRSGDSAAVISRTLEEDYRTKISPATIQRRLRTWGLIRRTRTVSTEDLRTRIKELYFEESMSHEDMIEALRTEGFSIGGGGLRRLMSEMKLVRRTDSGPAKECQDAEIRAAIERELPLGVIQGYGRELLHSHFKLRHLNASRNRLYRVYRTICPDVVDRPYRKAKRKRSEHIAPGPNFAWSIDGHDDLRPYGIQIHAGIDVFSHHVVWLHVGLPNRTELTCLSQYLHTIGTLGFQPRTVRSDRGGDAVLLAARHYDLRKATQPELEFTQCYSLGTSTAHERIESWWGQFTCSALNRWTVSLDRTVLVRMLT